jgi:glyoxylase-like metal-dependent hydrolase (beta-lactamase superfamily II)
VNIKTLAVGPLETNCYIVSDEDTGEALIIDPGDEPDRIMDFAEGLKVRYIVLTHAHFDHAGAVPEVKEATGAEIALHPGEREAYFFVSEQAALWGFDAGAMPEPDVILGDGDELRVGNTRLRVLHTPGHSAGGICLLGGGALFSGDTLFMGSVGRTDFTGGSMEQLKDSFRRLMGLPPETMVLPGHGPATTIGRERTGNILSEGA